MLDPRSMRFFGLLVILWLSGCSSARLGSEQTGQPSLIFPAAIAEGDNGDGGVAPAEGESATAQKKVAAEPAPPQFAPDPEPLSMASHWEYVLRYNRGDITVSSVRLLKFDKPVASTREMGRFALELWIGHELVERLRFDFPLLAAEPAPGPRTPLHQPPVFSAGADVSRRILVPASPRATRLVLVDRATGRVTPLPWPPTSAPGGRVSSAGP